MSKADARDIHFLQEHIVAINKNYDIWVIFGKMEVYDSGMDSSYSGTIGPKDKIFGIDWIGKKKLCIIS